MNSDRARLPSPSDSERSEEERSPQFREAEQGFAATGTEIKLAIEGKQHEETNLKDSRGKGLVVGVGKAEPRRRKSE